MKKIIKTCCLGQCFLWLFKLCLRLGKQAVGIKSCQTSHYYQNNSISWALRNTEKLKTSQFFYLLRKIGMKILRERGHLALELFAFLDMETWTFIIRRCIWCVFSQPWRGLWRLQMEVPRTASRDDHFVVVLLDFDSMHSQLMSGLLMRMAFGPFHTSLNTQSVLTSSLPIINSLIVLEAPGKCYFNTVFP